MIARRTLIQTISLVLLLLCGVPAQANDRTCTPNREGKMVCPEPDASCKADRTGEIICSTAGGGIELVPIDGPQADAIRQKDGFFAPDLIAADTYKGVGAVKTLAVGAQWVTSAKADTETVYQITKAMFSDATQKALGAGHAKGKFITKDNAVKGAGIPFHPGAERFYKEAGLLK